MYMKDTKKRQRIGNGKEKICYSRTSKIVEKIFFGEKTPGKSVIYQSAVLFRNWKKTKVVETWTI